MGAIAVEHLSLRYGGRDVAAVHDLTLDVADGEFIALVGPSGCGKTTTLRLLAGFLKPDEGRILVDGRVLSDAAGVVPPEARGMGMVFQNYAVWPHMTVFDNVAFGLAARHLKRDEIHERVTAMLATVDLAELARAYPSQLSGGQQQRVALARSLVVEPGTLLLDEPLSNLDAKLRERMRWELKELQRRTGVTFVYVTHDQAEAMAIADRVAVMSQGELQQYGAPRDVYARPANRFVADFMGTVNVVSGAVARASAGSATVRLLDSPSFDLDVPATGAPEIGTPVRVAVRPEDVLLDEPSGVPGRIERATFLGSLNDYVVTVPGSGPAAPLTLRVQATAREAYPEGAPVAVSIAPDRCVLVD